MVVVVASSCCCTAHLSWARRTSTSPCERFWAVPGAWCSTWCLGATAVPTSHEASWVRAVHRPQGPLSPMLCSKSSLSPSCLPLGPGTGLPRVRHRGALQLSAGLTKPSFYQIATSSEHSRGWKGSPAPSGPTSVPARTPDEVPRCMSMGEIPQPLDTLCQCPITRSNASAFDANAD